MSCIPVSMTSASKPMIYKTQDNPVTSFPFPLVQMQARKLRHIHINRRINADAIIAYILSYIANDRWGERPEGIPLAIIVMSADYLPFTGCFHVEDEVYFELDVEHFLYSGFQQTCHDGCVWCWSIFSPLVVMTDTNMSGLEG